MTKPYDHQVRKHLVNLMLNDDLVLQAHALTNNLSGVVESLLKDFVGRENQQRLVQAKSLEKTIATWDAFGDNVCSFANEHSTL